MITSAPALHPARPQRVAYLMSRFPKLSETFVLYEMRELEMQGLAVEVFPLINQREAVMHTEAGPFVARARYQPFVSAAILAAHGHFLQADPQHYRRLWAEVLRGTWGSPNYFFGALGLLPKTVCFAFEMQRMGITHIHAHFANHPALAALIINRLTGIPFSFTAHAHDLFVDQHMLCAKVQAAAFVVAISNYNREFIVQHCGEAARNKIRVIHCGADLRLFQPHQASPGQPFTIVCVGSLEPKKGQTHLVEACRLLKQRGLPFICHLVGHGRRREQLACQIAAAGLAQEVILAGGLPRDQVARLLHQADVAVLPSVQVPSGNMEGIPVALMEAMACALPTISTRLSGIPELIEDGVTGRLVAPGDSVALAEVLAWVAAQPEAAAALGQAARHKVLAEFDLRENAAQLAQAITQLSLNRAALC